MRSNVISVVVQTILAGYGLGWRGRRRDWGNYPQV